MFQNVEKEQIKEKGIEKHIEQNLKYPLLEINLNKIHENAKYTVDLCNSLGISVAGVVKGFNALPKVVEQFINAGCKYIAHSRMDQIIKLKQQGITIPIMMIRIPMLSEIDDLVSYVDISLNSEIETLEKIENQCEAQGKTHKVILMVDLGDLREGLVDEDEIINLALHVEKKLKSVELYGIGTNLGCYGSIKPTENNLGKLCALAEVIEEKINRKLDVISGGATSSLTLIMDGKMPKRINNLRLGEGILNARDLQDFWLYDMSNFHADSFVLKAEIVEIKAKPSHPVGEIFIDAFGNKPTYEDRGIRKRALLAVGKQDFAFQHSLLPRTKGVEVIGSSSDHLIIDIENCSENLKIGDILSFDIYYPNMLYLSGSTGINKVYVY
jgi:ornithine racemase